MSQTILSFDEGACRKLAEMGEEGRFADSALRVSVQEEGAAFRYQIEVVKQDEREEGDAEKRNDDRHQSARLRQLPPRIMRLDTDVDTRASAVRRCRV